MKLLPLYITASLLIFANNSIVISISYFAEHIEFTATSIGWLSGSFYFGFLIGCFFISKEVKTYGYVRLFGSLASLTSACVLVMALVPDFYVWLLVRMIMGFCIAGMFSITEAWLNSSFTNDNRARALSIYRFIDLFFGILAQYSILFFSWG